VFYMYNVAYACDMDFTWLPSGTYRTKTGISNVNSKSHVAGLSFAAISGSHTPLKGYIPYPNMLS